MVVYLQMKSTNIKENILFIFQFYKCNNQLLHLFTVKEFFAQKNERNLKNVNIFFFLINHITFGFYIFLCELIV